jgi:hypothetical protein
VHAPRLPPRPPPPTFPPSPPPRLTGFDPFSLSWFNLDQAAALWATLLQYNTLAVLVGHTHTAQVYASNGTHEAAWGSAAPGFIDVINAPATQKEDGKHNALLSEFMVLEAALQNEDTGAGTFRVAQRVGHGWGSVLAQKTFTCK